MITDLLARAIREEISDVVNDITKLQEIRLRVNQPIYVRYDSNEIEIPHLLSQNELRETVEYVSGYSIYAYEKELRQGYLTVEGGHRIGICGRIIMEKEEIKTIQYISSLNIRVAHEIKGCANGLFPYVINNGFLYNTVILSPPGCGKTTLLRDLVRQVSNGNAFIKGRQVAVLDERGEIAACYMGIPQNDVGSRTDVLEHCLKSEGIQMLLRSMSPEIIAVDEISSIKEFEDIQKMMNSGVSVIATAHGEKEKIQALKQYFQRIVLLKKEGKIGIVDGIYDGEGQKICG